MESALCLFAFIEGVIGVGWNVRGKKSKDTNKIQFYQMPKHTTRKKSAPALKAQTMESNFESLFNLDKGSNTFSMRICHQTQVVKTIEGIYISTFVIEENKIKFTIQNQFELYVHNVQDSIDCNFIIVRCSDNFEWKINDLYQ